MGNIKRTGAKLLHGSPPTTALASAMMLPSIILAFILFLVSGNPCHAQEKDAPYVPTPAGVVDKMLDMAGVGPGDYVVDLGCGDGRIVIEAARRGAIGLGVDIDPELIRKARTNAREAGVSDKVMFLKQDLFKTDISGASVITLYLYPSLINKLRPELIDQLKPGARIVSHDFDMNDWEPDRHATIKSNKILSDTLVSVSRAELDSFRLLSENLKQNRVLPLFRHQVHYWKVPAEARGHWKWQTNGKGFTMEAGQSYQDIRVEIRAGDTALNIKNQKLTGERINIRAVNPVTETRYLYSGRIDGDTIKGKVQIRSKEGNSIDNWTARRN